MVNTMQLKLIISDARHFFLGNINQIAQICLPWLVATALVEYLMATIYNSSQGIGPLYMLSWVFSLLVYPVYTAALILLMAARAKQERPDNRHLLSAAIRMWQPFFVVHMIGSGLTAVGLMLFIIPGVFVAVRLSFTEFFLVMENIKPLEAIQKSYDATKSYFGIILIILVIFVTPLVLLSLLLGRLLQGGQELGMILNVFISAATGFFMLFVDVVLFRLYMSATQKNPTT